MRSTGETLLSKKIGKALDKLGIRHIRIQSGVLLSGGGAHFVHCAPKGTPDRVLPGLGWIEVKAPGKKLSPDQREWQAWAAAQGINHAVCDNVADAIDVAMQWKREGGRA